MLRRAPRFWWRDRPTLLARLLQPLGDLYGRIVLRRMRQPGTDAGLPVICVGNFVAGGAGKTPTAIALARMLRDELGRCPAFLSRGYGGRLVGPVAVDPARHCAADVGDEPLLLAREALTVISRKRAKGAMKLVEEGADLIIMDDGFQSARVHADFALVVVDARRGIGNGRVFPAGPLRAPLDVQINAASALLLV